METVGKFVLAVIVSAIAWVFFGIIIHIFPSMQHLFENYFIAAGMLYISICMGLSFPIGIVVTIVLGIILSDIWYAPVIQYIILELVIKLVLAISMFTGASIVIRSMDRLAKKSPEPVANPEPETNHAASENNAEFDVKANIPKINTQGEFNPLRTKRIRHEIKKIYDRHSDVLDVPILTPQNYDFVSTYYLIILIGELDGEAIDTFTKGRLEVDLSMLYCGVGYYSYLLKYAKGKNYNAAVISAIHKSRNIFYRLYTDNRDPLDVNYYDSIVVRAILTYSKHIPTDVLSNDIAYSIGKYVIFEDPSWECYASNANIDREYMESKLFGAIARWELDFVVPLAYKFIDNMQEFIMTRK